jgi:hypothetical protein
METSFSENSSELFVGDEAPGFEAVHCRWSRRHLSYCFVGGPPPNLGTTAFETVRAAFAVWRELSVLSFSETDASVGADIRVVWTYGPSAEPGSLDEFYGPGDKVAMGYYPFPHLAGLAGDLHFDAAEQWTNTSSPGVDLFGVALHEIGHCVGLGHCFGRPTAMAPSYSQASRVLEAADRDALALKYADVP